MTRASVAFARNRGGRLAWFVAWVFRVFLVVGERRAALVDPFAQLGDQQRDIGGDLRLPGGLEPRGRQLALPGAEVEPGGADLGAVERDQGVAPLDLLSQHDVNLADDAGGAGTDLDLPVRVGLDHPDDGDPGRDPVEPRRLDRDLGLLELGLRQ